jgi:hypothetical protein
MQPKLSAAQTYNCRYPRQTSRGRPRKDGLTVKEVCLGIRDNYMNENASQRLTAPVDNKT